MYDDDIDGEFDIYESQVAEGPSTTVVYLSPEAMYKYYLNGEEATLEQFEFAIHAILWDEFSPPITVEQSQEDDVNIIKITALI